MEPNCVQLPVYIFLNGTENNITYVSWFITQWTCQEYDSNVRRLGPLLALIIRLHFLRFGDELDYLIRSMLQKVEKYSYLRVYRIVIKISRQRVQEAFWNLYDFIYQKFLKLFWISCLNVKCFMYLLRTEMRLAAIRTTHCYLSNLWEFLCCDDDSLFIILQHMLRV